MGTALSLLYLVGFLAAIAVGRSRAGLTQSGRVSLGTMVTSPEWFAHQMASMFLWPAFVVTWLARGRPASPWQTSTSSRGQLRVRRRARADA